jgi:hypothetical protein
MGEEAREAAAREGSVGVPGAPEASKAWEARAGSAVRIEGGLAAATPAAWRAVTPALEK